jgi:ATP-dependent Clp protease ATP-binding subunit ClpA
VIIFKGLTKDDAVKVLEILFTSLKDRLKELGIEVSLTEKGKKYILEKGFSTEYGARPLRRVLQHEVENLIADYILEKNLLHSKNPIESMKLEIDLQGKKLVIK